MNGITHKQAQKYLRLNLDGLLTDDQRRDLEAHLSGCEACRLEARAFSTLTSRLQSGFRSRWDAQDGPSKNVMANVRSQTRRIIMSNRISLGIKALAGVAALFVFGFLLNLVVPQMRDRAADNVTPTSSERLVAFVSEENGNPDIYTMYPDGSGLRNLTNNPANDINPYFSPDGKRIAFQSDRDNGFMNLYIMNADGSGLTQVTNNDQPTANGHHDFGVSDHNPWSQDGSKLLFTEWIPDNETWKLYSVGVDGQNKTLLAPVTQAYSYPSWSPDGKHIAYITTEQIEDREVARIHVVDVDGKNDVNVTSMLSKDVDLSTWTYSWTREGNIRFAANRVYVENDSRDFTVYEVTVDGATLAEIMHTSTGPGDTWDGATFVVGATGETLTWLRSDGTYTEFKPFEKCQPGVDGQYFSSLYKRSSNGYLMFGAGCPNGDWWFTWANPQGTTKQQLLGYPLPLSQGLSNMVWSPDGKYVALNAVSSGNSYLYVVDVSAALKDSSTKPVKISLSDQGQYYNISWQPIP